MYVFGNVNQRENRINNRKDVMVIEITKLEAKLKAQCTQALERYQIYFIRQFRQEREREFLNLLGSISDVILADWRIANVLVISERETCAPTNPLD